MIRLSLADEHPIMLAGMQAWLEATPGMSVVGAATNGDTALAFCESLRPDIALVDIALPGIDGIELVRRLRRAALPTRVIIFSASGSSSHLRQAFEAGARGYVLKRSAVDHLVLAIRAVQDGGIYFDPALSAPFWNGIHGTGHPDQVAALTARETDVLRAVAFGFSMKETAAQFGLTTKSIETYKPRACDKLALTSRAHIVRYAVAQGWFAETSTSVDVPAALTARSASRLPARS